MRRLVLILWLLVPVGAGAYHLGPGQDHMRLDEAARFVAEAQGQEFLGWLKPGRDKFSANRIFLSSLRGRVSFDLTTLQHGSPRAMMPIGSFENVMPLDVLATPLLKSLLVHDTVTALALGCLELEEEDLALCSFVCCSKYDYGEALRDCLEIIEESG